jgi:L-alanine-DL-glutamate epimerase-like enolase superfamily enzyme
MATRAHQRGRRGMLMMAISGIDIALWDIVGQAVHTPLYRLLGGYRDTLDAYASAGFYAQEKDAAALAEEVGGYVERGFRYVKIKVGRNPEVLVNIHNNEIWLSNAENTIRNLTTLFRLPMRRKAIQPSYYEC